MTTTVAIEQLTLQDLEQRLGLQRSDDPDFFQEWRDPLPELGAIERDRLLRPKGWGFAVWGNPGRNTIAPR